MQGPWNTADKIVIHSMDYTYLVGKTGFTEQEGRVCESSSSLTINLTIDGDCRTPTSEFSQ